jgi:4-amino-4-deoxy-L-arabinose transferase-like glycosyltransferase
MRFRGRGRIIGLRWITAPWPGSDFSADNALTGSQAAPENERAVGVEVPHRIAGPFDRILRDRVPRSWVLALALMLFVYLFTCGGPRLFDQIDGQYAGAAREMMARGDWLIPTQNGVPRLQKPPLVYWCEALSMSVFGVNEFAARFPVALATVGWFLAAGLLARRVVGSRSAGLAGALALAMFAGTFFFTHLVMPEPFLGCLMALSFWSLLKAVQSERIPDRKEEIDRWLLATWAFIALSTFAKGIHGLLIPVAALSCTAWLRPSMRTIWCRLLLRPQGWLLFLAVLAPWYLVTEWRYPGFLKDHFFNEQIGSALSRRSPPDSDRVPLWIFWPEQLVLLFPVSLLIPAAVKASIRKIKDRQARLSEEGVLLLSWFLVVAFGISFANIQDYYLMIAWTPVAIWIAWAVTRNEISYRWPAFLLSFLGASGLILALCLGVTSGNVPWQSSSSSALIGDTILNVFQVLPPAVWKEIIPLLAAASTAVLVAGMVVFLFDRKGRSKLCLAVFAFLMATIFAIGTRGLQLVEDEFSSEKVAELIDSKARPGSMVIAQGDPNEKTTLFFYLRRPIYWVDGHPNIEFATRILEIGLDRYLARQQVAQRWRETNQVFLVIESSSLPEWKAYLSLAANQSIPIGACGSRVILVNR